MQRMCQNWSAVGPSPATIVWQRAGLFPFPVEDRDLPCRHKMPFPLLHMESLLLHCQSSCRQNSWSFQAACLLLMQESLCGFSHTSTSSSDSPENGWTSPCVPCACRCAAMGLHPKPWDSSSLREESWHSVLNNCTNNCFSKDYLRQE